MNLYRKLLRIGVAAAMAAIPVVTMWAQREIKTINDNWEFRKPSDDRWQRIHLPHTFNLDAYLRPDYYRGEGLYRRILTLSEVAEERCYYLKVDAASKAAVVNWNGQEIGHHLGGYSAFTLDITDLLRKENVIEITVDNSRRDITPVSADFTFWGGIYRDVWLISTARQHFRMDNMGSDGIFISTPEVSEESAKIKVCGEVTNDACQAATLEVRSMVYNPEGKLVYIMNQNLKLKSGETRAFEITSDAIANPSLWTPETPSLYLVKTMLVDSKTGRLLDEQIHKTGFRWFSFDGNKGFCLNGKPYKLRGVNRHQDQAPVGVALDDEAHRRDIRLMKEFGCNFIRISHFPQDDAILEMCDELGLLVWEEIPVINTVPDTPGYDDNCEYNLREMIRQHYNHPSVIAWGYMNEILLTAPPVNSPEWAACRERTVTLARRLEAALKEEDSSRVSVMAYNMTDVYNEIGLDLIDVVGWNLYQGWYVDKLDDFNAWCEDKHLRYPDKPMIISEWGAGSDRRLHTVAGRAFDFSIEYHQNYTEHYLSFIEEKEWICGCAYWNFVDFNSAGRQESMPRINNKGMFYNDRTPKDVAYYFKAMWRKDIPVLHIASRDWQVRTEEVGKPQPIKLYSNLSEVELFVNGQSVGRQKTANSHTVFQVMLPEGVSVLLAKGVKDGKTVQDAMTIRLEKFPDLAKGDELAINVGSNCYFISNVSHLSWLPDQPYTPGSWGYVGGKSRSTTSEIHNTLDGPVYQTWLEGLEGYKIDVPTGMYEVELLFADVSRPAQQLANLLGKDSNEKKVTANLRFDITICGKTVEKGFSPAENNRYLHACRKRYIVTNAKDCIDISFNSVQGLAVLSGVKVRKL